MNKVLIVQARMASTRLPGKILKTVLGKPLLEYQIERLKRVKLKDEIVIATTTKDTEEPIIELCERLNVPYFRGSEEDVLSRYYWAAQQNHADLVIRITSDCPIIDPAIIDKVIEYYLIHSNQFDYVSNTLERTFPRGMDTEVFSFKALSEAYNEAKDESEREHVTPFIYRNTYRYRLANVSYFEDQSKHRWTVDTMEDFQLIKRIIEHLYPINPSFTLEDTLKLLQEHPDWYYLNAHIEQKKIDS